MEMMKVPVMGSELEMMELVSEMESIMELMKVMVVMMKSEMDSHRDICKENVKYMIEV